MGPSFVKPSSAVATQASMRFSVSSEKKSRGVGGDFSVDDGGDEVGGDGGGDHVAGFCDLLDGFSGFEVVEGFELGAGEAAFGFHFRWSRGFEWVEALFLVGLEVSFDLGHEGLAVVFEFLGADSGDIEKIGFGLWVAASHVAEGGVAENDVGRD